MVQSLLESIYDDYKKNNDKIGKEYDKTLKVKKTDSIPTKFPKTTAQPFYPRQYYYGYKDPYFQDKRSMQSKPQY